VLVALLVCLIPTTIGGLLSAIGIAGMDRLVQRNVLAMSPAARSRPPATSTRCCSTRPAPSPSATAWPTEFIPCPASTDRRAGRARAARAWPTRRPRAVRSSCSPRSASACAGAARRPGAQFVPFTAQTRMSGVDLRRTADGRRIRKGAVDAVRAWVARAAGQCRPTLAASSTHRRAAGGTPLVVAEGARCSA
jgi:K+-transporting ATPase ATPase B chain